MLSAVAKRVKPLYTPSVAKSFVERTLMPGERIIHAARVHYIVYVSGFVMCLFSLYCGYFIPKWQQKFYYVYTLVAHIEHYMPQGTSLAGLISGLSFTAGISWMLYAYAIAVSTELVVTDRRIIAKSGIMNVVTTEIDRRKIAGCIIHQTPFGQIFRYGRIILKGYTGDIRGFPPLAKPYDFQKFVNARVRY
jgi:hypothetical protein